MSENPIQERYRIESLKKTAEVILGSKNFSLWAFFYVALIMCVAAWLPGGIEEIFWGKQEQGFYKLITALFILFWMYFKLKHSISSHQKIVVERKTPTPVKNLVIFLSPMKKEDIEQVINTPEAVKEGRKNWEMPYLAVQHHKSELTNLFVITSSGEGATTNQFAQFMAFIKKAFPDNKFEVTELTPNGMDFENIEDVFNLIEDFYKGQGIKEEDVLVDITGGQKTNTIAGALATLSLGRKFQYISTKDKQVYAYDVAYFEQEE